MLQPVPSLIDEEAKSGSLMLHKRSRVRGRGG